MLRFAALALMVLPVAGQAEGIWSTMTGHEITQALSDRTLAYEKAEQTFYASGKTLYNRWKRWRDMWVFARIMEGLAAETPDNKTISIDATYLKAHRTASSLSVKKGGVDV